MNWSWADVWNEVGGRADDLYRAFTDREAMHAIQGLASPVDPFNRSTLLTPMVSVVGVVGVVMLSGVALASAVVAAAALTALYFLLSRVFGFEVTLDPDSKPR